MTTHSTSHQGHSRFRLRTLFVVVAACALVAAITRSRFFGFVQRAEGKRQWSKLCKDVSIEPASVTNRLDEFLSLERRGKIIFPEQAFLFNEAHAHALAYLSSLEQMDADDFLNSVEQFHDALAGRRKFGQQIGVRGDDIPHAAAKIVAKSVNNIASQQEGRTASATDSQAPLNILINDLAALKNKLPRLLWDIRNHRRERPTLPENPTWEDITGLKSVAKNIRPALEPIILNDLKMISANDPTLSTRLPQPMLEAYKQRVKNLRWLCEYSEDEFVIPEVAPSD